MANESAVAGFLRLETPRRIADCGHSAQTASVENCEFSPVRWNFVRHEDGQWSWLRQRLSDGAEDVSEIRGEFGEVISNAFLHGFRPEQQGWSITHKGWSTHFSPGAPPRTTPLAETPTGNGAHKSAGHRR